MANYNSALFSPPAPLSFVTLLNPDNGLEELEVPMLLDTGSDVTLVPRISAEKVKVDLSSSRQYELAGFDNQKSQSQLVKLHMILKKKLFEVNIFS